MIGTIIGNDLTINKLIYKDTIVSIEYYGVYLQGRTDVSTQEHIDGLYKSLRELFDL